MNKDEGKDFSWELDEFDSSILGFTVAKITYINPHISSESLSRLVEELVYDLKEKQISYVLCRVHANNFFLIHTLEKAGFLLVDGFMSLKKKLESSMDKEEKKEIREANENDFSEVTTLGGSVFSFNRLYNDPFIPKDKADMFYSKWTKNCLIGKVSDKVLVFDEDQVIKGFIALQKNGHIPLIGVDHKYRGKGIAKQLILASFSYFSSWSLEEISIETQVANIPALRAYISCGFSIIDTQFSFAWHL